jgi:hypothetical protein
MKMKLPTKSEIQKFHEHYAAKTHGNKLTGHQHLEGCSEVLGSLAAE